MTKQNSRIITYLVLVMIYIFPNGLLFGSFNAIHNHIFAAILALLHISTKKINKKTLLFWGLVIIVSVYTGRYGFIDMVIIPILGDYIKQKEEIKKVIYKSNIPYVCVLFTLIYSIIYKCLGIGGRAEEGIAAGLLITALGESNLAGLSTFGLGLIVRKKNNIIGNFVLVLGLLTVSRSYILALFCVFLFSLNHIKKIIRLIIDKLSYFRLTVFSSLAIYFLGVFYIALYQSGGILPYNASLGFDRIFHLNDYSNFFRFLAIYLIVMIMYKNPRTLLFGFSDDEFIEYGKKITSMINVEFIGTGTHNLFFSHLKMYGLAVFFEIYFISKKLKTIINVNNFGIFISVFLYCIILGTGLSSYWLYLTTILLVLHETTERRDQHA